VSDHPYAAIALVIHLAGCEACASASRVAALANRGETDRQQPTTPDPGPGHAQPDGMDEDEACRRTTG
jgi:hypothetical protein